MRSGGWRRRRSALLRLLTTMGVLWAPMAEPARAAPDFEGDLVPVPADEGPDNRADLTLTRQTGANDFDVSYVTSCGFNDSFLRIAYVDATRQLTLKDGVICGTDVVFFEPPYQTFLGDLFFRTGASAGLADPIVGTVAGDGHVHLVVPLEVYTYVTAFGFEMGERWAEDVVELDATLVYDDVAERYRLDDVSVPLGVTFAIHAANLTLTGSVTLHLESVAQVTAAIFQDGFDTGVVASWAGAAGPVGQP